VALGHCILPSECERLVDEVVGEELLEYIEIAFALHLFGVPADDSLAASLDELLLIVSLRSLAELIACIATSRGAMPWVQ
jgi:hypothetical protein